MLICRRQTSLSAENISLLDLVETALVIPLVPSRLRGVRVVTNVGAGCDGRWRCIRRNALAADDEAVWS